VGSVSYGSRGGEEGKRVFVGVRGGCGVGEEVVKLGDVSQFDGASSSNMRKMTLAERKQRKSKSSYVYYQRWALVCVQ